MTFCLLDICSKKCLNFSLIYSRPFLLASRTFRTCSAVYKTPDEETFYDALDISPGSNSKEIKAAYIELSKKYHPDRNPDSPEAAAKFQQVSEAYATLGQPKLRRAYDRGQLKRDSSVADYENASHDFEGARFVHVRITKTKSKFSQI